MPKGRAIRPALLRFGASCGDSASFFTIFSRSLQLWDLGPAICAVPMLETGRKAARPRAVNRSVSVAFIAAIAILIVTLVAAAPAGAAFGQIGSGWGEFGSGKAEFDNPGLFGVDPTDGSVFAGDITADSNHYRIQKLSGEGAFKASVEVPRWLNDKPTEEKILGMHGIAVDHEKGLLYMVEGCRVTLESGNCRVFGGFGFNARRILVYKTAPEGEKLVPAAVPSFTLPIGAEELYEPQAIAVDPSSHDIVLLAENGASHLVVQRISSSGVLGARYTDTTNALKPGSRPASTIAVGPDGTTYTMTGGIEPGSANTRAWRLPSSLASLEAVPGFAAAAEAEAWPKALLAGRANQLIGGPQLAISSDGETLYWKEKVTASSTTEAGNILVRGYSLKDNETEILFGGGEGTCEITTSAAGLATAGEHVVVFDFGPEVEEGKTPSYGVKVLTFGPGGSGCPVAEPKLKINGSEAVEVTAAKGATVQFDASGSKFPEGAVAHKVVWKFGDGQEKTVEGEGETGPATLTTSHAYASSGDFTFSMQITLVNSTVGSPPPVERTIHILGAKPNFNLKAILGGNGSGTVTSSPSGISCPKDCEEAYEEDTEVTLTAVPDLGSTFSGWTGGGCAGGGTCKVTITAATEVTATFTLEQHQLKVIPTGTGAGASTVSSSPAGIECGAICQANFDHNAVVTLSAASGANVKPVQWTGCGEVTGENKCKVTMSAAKEVTAKFDSEQHLLKVNPSGTGAGTVTSAPAGISCGSTCEASFDHNTAVTLSAVSNAGTEPVQWTGCDSVISGECKVTISAAKEVTAKFDPIPGQFGLKVIKTGTGSGTVTSAPAGINCGSGAGCEAAFVEGANVVLSAVADVGTKPVQWTGCGEVSGENKCKVTMSAAKEVTAKFDPEQHLLKVKKVGTGTGTVISVPSGINCGSGCEASFNHGVSVTLAGASGANTKAVQWTGCDAIVGANECKVTISAAKEVTATFDLNPSLPVSNPPVIPPSNPTPPPVETKPKLTPKQKALAKCKKLKGKAKAKCVKKANSIGKHKHGRKRLRGRD
jgi:Divergent InlB B-repeat domain/PKD domain